MGNNKNAKPNFWRDHHNSLNDANKLQARTVVMQALEWSEATFYRKMRTNEKLKNYESILVCNAYGVAIADFFPDSDLVKPVKKAARKTKKVAA